MPIPHPDDDTDTDEWGGISLEAFSLVHGDRGACYDHPMIDYSRTCDLFRAMTGHELEPAEGVLFMMAVKLSRVAAALESDLPAEMWRDSRVDLAGYAECLDGIVTWVDGDDDDEGGEDVPEPVVDPSAGATG